MSSQEKARDHLGSEVVLAERRLSEELLMLVCLVTSLSCFVAVVAAEKKKR